MRGYSALRDGYFEQPELESSQQLCAKQELCIPVHIGTSHDANNATPPVGCAEETNKERHMIVERYASSASLPREL
jgi:hypothetical protein